MKDKNRVKSLSDPAPTVLTHGRRKTHNEMSIPAEIDGAATVEDKPPYRIPLMSEVAEIAPNGLRVVSTFSGCGGACLGLTLAGYTVVWASEFIPAAAETYRANFPNTPLDTRDIREVTAQDILTATGMAVGEIDLLEGSPPCASFSTAGKRAEGWGAVRSYSDTKQRVDDLFDEYVRLLCDLQPRAFIAENVSGLVKGVAKGYFKRIFREMQDAGYVVESRLLDAQWLGTPQARQRIIFMGVRNDLGKSPSFPKPLQYRYSIRDALPWVSAVEVAGPQFTPGTRSGNQPSPTIVQSGNASCKDSPFTLVEVEPRFYRDNRGAFGNGSEVTNDPSPTVLAGSVGTHWVEDTERRKFSIAELRRVCGFPDDFILTGTYAQQWERLGRAVVPPMYWHVGAVLARDAFGVTPNYPPGVNE